MDDKEVSGGTAVLEKPAEASAPPAGPIKIPVTEVPADTSYKPSSEAMVGAKPEDVDRVGSWTAGLPREETEVPETNSEPEDTSAWAKFKNALFPKRNKTPQQ